MPPWRASATTSPEPSAVEAIDHDPVEAGQRAHLARAFVEESASIVGGLVEPRRSSPRTVPVASPWSARCAGSPSMTIWPPDDVDREVEAVGRRRRPGSRTAARPRRRRAAGPAGCAARGWHRRRTARTTAGRAASSASTPRNSADVGRRAARPASRSTARSGSRSAGSRRAGGSVRDRNWSDRPDAMSRSRQFTPPLPCRRPLRTARRRPERP